MSLVRKVILIQSLIVIVFIAYLGLSSRSHNFDRKVNEKISEKASYSNLSDTISSNQRRLQTSNIKIFDLISYKQTIASHPVQQNLCKLKHLLKVSYHICTHDPKQDHFVSKSIIFGRGYEVDLTRLLSKMLQAYGNEAIFLDVGANIGSHLLFAAAKGHSVWGVEPQVTNLVKMYHSAEMDRTNSKITLLQNTLDKEYLNVSIKQTLGNIGGSYVTNVNEDPSLETVQSILFSDVFEHIQFNKPTTKRLIIILKIDIESYECRAFLGSPQILNSTDFYIPYVAMEWTYAKGKPPNKYPQACPRESVIGMTKLFTNNGYVPYTMKNQMLDAEQSDTWVMHVIWQHRHAHPLFRTLLTHHPDKAHPSAQCCH